MVASSADAPGGGLCALRRCGNGNAGVVIFYPQEPEQNVEKKVQEGI